MATVEQEGRYTYVTVRNIQVVIKEDDEGVVVDLFPNSPDWDGSSIGSLWEMYSEVDGYLAAEEEV